MIDYELHNLSMIDLVDTRLRKLYNDIDQLVQSNGYPPFWPAVSRDLETIRLQWTNESIYCSIFIDEELDEPYYLFCDHKRNVEIYSRNIIDISNVLFK